MSEVRSELLITLVHGTWPRGLFPKIVRVKHWVRGLMRRKGPAPFWFEEGSRFLDRLSTELGDIPHKIRPLLWSGANSIFVRDKTAQVLAEQLANQHAENPQATQVVIAHSHGGNIALRALHHLKQRDTAPSCEEGANPLLVTLATPFIEVQQADSGPRPMWVRVTLFVAILFFQPIAMIGVLYLIGDDLFDRFWPLTFFIFFTVWILGFILIVWWGVTRTDFVNFSDEFPALWPVLVDLDDRWFAGRLRWWLGQRQATARQNRVRALKDATQLGSVSAQRLLVIRAIDDEASLVMALGTIVNHLIMISIRYVFLLLFLLLLFLPEKNLQDMVFEVIIGFSVLTIMLLGLLMVSRVVHGCELAISPMECQINTQSTPDAFGLSKVVTLVRRKYVKSLRHGIYDHGDCPKAISDWVRSQLYAPREFEP
jgi:hypothetical protein